MGELLAVVFFFGFLICLAAFGKYMLVIFAVITGNKEMIAEDGNLCEDPKKPFAQKLAEWHKEAEWRREGGCKPKWRS